MGLQGADVAELRRLATELNRAAQRLDSARSTLTHQVGFAAFWQGPIADLFRGEWNNTSARQIAAAAQCLREAARDVLRNADEQERASTPDAGQGGATDTDDPLEDILKLALNIGNVVTDTVDAVKKGASGLPGVVLSKVAAPVLAVVDFVEGTSEGDNLKVALAVAAAVGIGVAAVGGAPVSVAVGLGFLVTQAVAPTSDAEIRELQKYAGRKQYGRDWEHLTDAQRKSLQGRSQDLPSIIGDKIARHVDNAQEFFRGLGMK